MNRFSLYTKSICAFLLIIMTPRSLGLFNGLTSNASSTTCGQWQIVYRNPEDAKRIGVSLTKQESGSECAGLFTLKNKTGTLLGGGYSLELSNISDNAKVEYLPSNDPFLLPGLDVDMRIKPIDIRKPASINLRGEVTLGSYLAVDLGFFLLRSAVDFIPLPTGCLISYDQLLLISFRTGPILEDTVKLFLNGDFQGAKDELSRVLDIFIEKASEYAKESGKSCFADYLKLSIVKSLVASGKMVLSAFTWAGNVIFDYFKYRDQPVQIEISYFIEEQTYVTDSPGLSNTKTPLIDITPKPLLGSGKIALGTCINDNEVCGVFTINTDGSNKKQLTSYGSSPSISPDAKEILFNSCKDVGCDMYMQKSEIYKMDANGQNIRRLTYTEFNNHPSWSPDGLKIAFESGHYGFKRICVMNADGSGSRCLTEKGSGNPTWYPDGKSIIGDVNGEIISINLDGSNQKYLTNISEMDFHPVWSPDGKKIAFSSGRSGRMEIYIIKGGHFPAACCEEQ